MRAALSALVPRPDESRRPLAQVRAWAKRASTGSLACASVAASISGPWTVVVELGAARSVPTAMLARLSRHGNVVSLADDAQLDAALVVARSGRVVRQIDPVLGTAAGTPQPAERGVEFGVRTSLSAMARALLVIDRLTGVQLTRADVTGDIRTPAVGYCA